MKSTITSLFLAAMLALGCGSVAAAQAPDGYVLVSQSSDGSMTWLYTPSIKKVSSANVRAWTLRNFGQKQPSGMSSIKDYVEYDCDQKRTRLLQADTYNEPWAVDPDITIGPKDWRFSSPGSTVENTLNAVCTRAGFGKR